MKLYFTRHGETEWNLLHRIQGQHDSPLTEKGIAQALRLKKRLDGICFDRVISSPLGRAMQTAELLCEGTGLIPEGDDRLKEVNLGDMECGLMADWPEEWVDAFYHAPERFAPVNGERYADALLRVTRLIRELETEDGCVLLIGHALILRLIRICLLDLPLHKMMDAFTPGCCFCEAEYRNGHWTLLTFGEDTQCPDPSSQGSATPYL